jgi:hypothetical protein
VKAITKPNPLKGVPEALLRTYAHPSVNVAIFNAAAGKADRVGIDGR